MMALFNRKTENKTLVRWTEEQILSDIRHYRMELLVLQTTNRRLVARRPHLPAKIVWVNQPEIEEVEQILASLQEDLLELRK